MASKLRLILASRPFTTRMAILAHEEAIVFFGGMTKEFVYDQDTLLLIAENYGDLIMTGSLCISSQKWGSALFPPQL